MTQSKLTADSFGSESSRAVVGVRKESSASGPVNMRSEIIGAVTASESRAADPEHSAQEFERIRPLYEELEEVVVRDLTDALHGRELDKQVHRGVTSRVKEVDSFRKKIIDRKYDKPFEDTTDLLGVRIVCLYPSVLQDIDTVIRETFSVLRYEDKGKSVEPEVWRYSSVHYDCTLPDHSSGQNHDAVKGLVFEIQVRTILQDAWATVEHQLGYKPERKIPDELKREFSALAGLFHVADERFQFIADQIQKLERAQDIAKQLAPLYRAAIEANLSSRGHAEDLAGADPTTKELESNPDGVINRGSVKVLLKGAYPGRRRKRNPDYTRLAQDLNSAGIATLHALGKALIIGDPAARESERESGPLSDVEFARRAVSDANPDFQSSRGQSRRRQPRSTAGEPRAAKNSPANLSDSPIISKARQHLDDALLDLRLDGELTPFVIVDGPHGMMYVSLPPLSDDDFWRTAKTDVPAIIILYEATEMVLVTLLDDSEVCAGRECVAVAHWGPRGHSLFVAPVSRRYNKPPRIGDWRNSASSTERIDAVGDGFRGGTELAKQLRESSSSSDAELLERIDLIRITAGAEDADVLPHAVAVLRRSRWLD